MKDSIATAPRNLFHIKRRQAVDIGFRALRRIGIAIAGRPDSVSEVLLYPSVESEAALEDIVNRLAWYLPAENVESHSITLPLADDVPHTEPTESPDSQPTYDRTHLNIEFVGSTEANDRADSADKILCNDVYRAFGETFLKNIDRVEIVDPTFYSTTACATWINGTSELRRTVTDQSRENFRRFEEERTDCDRSFVFATGPSLEEAYSFEFPDSALKIVCNSMVRNEELLEHIDPDVLVFADPVFHFGPSKYAHTFRGDAAEVIQKYDCTVAVPKTKRSLLIGHYPEIREQVIGIESVSSNLPRFPTHRSLDVMGTSNIMTLLMLPIASSLTDSVHIIGADGREETESYFWEHSDIAQYDDEMMKTAADTHPSFFRDRIYTDYYEQHVETLEEMIEYGERQGIEYTSLTESHIKCLQNRYDTGTPGQ